MIRLATEADGPALAAIYAPYVLETAISFELEPPGGAEMSRRVAAVLQHAPWLVFEEDGRVAAYAYASKHRERAAYQWSVDVAVYVARGQHRRGAGRTLYTKLFALLRMQNFAAAHAGVTLPNDASAGLHEALGFVEIGTYRRVGFKLGAWHDVRWYQLELRERRAEPSPPIVGPAARDLWMRALGT